MRVGLIGSFASGLLLFSVCSQSTCAKPAALSSPREAIVAMTPPMGWNPFNAFRLDYDEAEIISAAEALVKLDLARKGYRYVNIDDGWWLRRETDGITIRTGLFPSAKGEGGRAGMQPFVTRLHLMGLKAGIYTDIGRNTCSQRYDKSSPNLPEGTLAQREVGTLGHNRSDAALFFAKWNFDFIKVDACGVADYSIANADVASGHFQEMVPLIVRNRLAASDAKAVARLYADFAEAVHVARPQAQPIIAICAWGEADVNDWGGRYGQMWRTSADISPTWSAMLRNFDSAAPRSLFAGPGRWNDPDLLELGNGDFNAQHLTEARAHMSMWAIIAAPLMLSYDLGKAPASIHEIAGNREVIAIDQDPAGNQGVIVARDGQGEIIVKQLNQRGQKALALINRGAAELHLSVDLADLHLDRSGATMLRDVWAHRSWRLVGSKIEASLAPHETRLLRLDGRAADARTVFPAEIPARITVSHEGFKPDDRSAEHPWVPARIGFSPDGLTTAQDGHHDMASVGAAAGSHLRIALRGEFKRFRVSPSMPGAKGGRFEILADGKLLDAGAIGDRALSFSVRRVQILELVAPPKTGKANAIVWSGMRLER